MSVSTFKNVQLFRLSSDLGVATDTLVNYLKQQGMGAALKGSGPNAKVTTEEAYVALLQEFSKDQKKLEEYKRLKTEAEEEDAAVRRAEEELVARKAAEEAEAKRRAEEEAAAARKAAEEAEARRLAEEAEAAARKAAEEAEALRRAQEEAEAQARLLQAKEAESRQGKPEAKPAVAKKAEPAPLPIVEPEPEPEVEVTPEPEADGVAVAEVDVEPQDLEVIRADRYQLEGVKVLGTVDLSQLGMGATPGNKRRRKRKGGELTPPPKPAAGAAAPETPPAAPAPKAKEAPTTPAKQADSRKAKKGGKQRGPQVDVADVELAIQETKLALEGGHGHKARSKRKKNRREERAAEREAEESRSQEESRVLKVQEFISTGDLASMMDVSVNEVISKLFSSGMMVSINQRLDADTITFVADEFGFEVSFITDFDDVETEDEEVDDPATLVERPPVVTIMGHVDHGKTSLLDYIRKANVVAGEAGGITQHIGAYQVVFQGKPITFLDTPGHEAFTAMRARGAQVTDIVVLVVAADDSVMPQTIEAINHAKAAGVPIVVAINKIDKPDANPTRVMQQLADYGVLVEQYGGSVQNAEVSAKMGLGIEDLLEKVLIQAEFLELKANPERRAQGVVIESRLDRGRGVVSTLLVQNGTLKVGDVFVCGIHSGRIRAMFDERDQRLAEVGPGSPCAILGVSGSPEVGDRLVVMEDEREARDIAQRRQQIHREQQLRQRKHITLDEIGRRLALGDFRELNLIIKGDVGGSVEALSDSLLKISAAEVAVRIIHSGVGAITESDVMLASASDAVIIGFQVRPSPGAKAIAEREQIDIRTYSIIYDVIQEIRDALEGMLSPERSEKILGVAQVRQIFRVPKVGTIAGCMVVEGKIRRSDKIRLIRDGVVIYQGGLGSLKRIKDDVREVLSGFECGMGIDGYNDLKEGDQIEAFEIIETRRRLQTA